MTEVGGLMKVLGDFLGLCTITTYDSSRLLLHDVSKTACDVE